ncbi:MAG: Xaa-Pro peptidase family protein [Acidobacteriaceae bacterium]
MSAADLGALLVAHLPDVRYLCGFAGSSGVLVVAAGKLTLFTDGRYTEQAKKEAPDVKVILAKGSPLAAACAWIDAAGIERCGYDPTHTTVTGLVTMRAGVSPKRRRSLFQAAEGLVSGLREVKDEAEIATMREAARLGSTIFEETLQDLTPSMTEVQVALELERRARTAGADGMSFDSIVAGGPRSALPHARPTLERLPRTGFVTLDFGVVWHGYCSDMTRSVHLGKLSAEARGVYDSVLEAQRCAIACVAPGVQAGEVDEAARGVLRRCKLDGFFSHSTGHGLGLEIHEQPRLGAQQRQELKAGMIITIEPGVYLEGRFGVRIEDMVLVTDGGHEVLTTSTTALIEL